MEQIIQNLQEALTWIYQSIDWVYLVVFILTTWLVTRNFLESNLSSNVAIKKTKWMLWLTPKQILVLANALLWIIVFGIFFTINKGFPWITVKLLPYSFTLMTSFIFGIFINEFFGIEKILDNIFKTKLNK